MKILTCLFLFFLTLATASAGDTASLESNKIVVRKVFEEILGKGLIDENEGIYAPEFAAHGLNGDANREQDRQATKAWRAAFPDLKMTVTHLVAEGDLVTVRFLGEGTNTGPFFSGPPTGKPVKVVGITIFKLKGGKITDEWTSFDQMALLQQLGMIPSPAGTK